MRGKVFLMVPVAIGLGLVAIKSGRHWLDRQVDDRLREASSATQPAPKQIASPTFGTIVVASARLKFGAELAPNVLREIPWPDAQPPRGSFAHVADLDKDKRFVLSALEEGEAVLASKITGPGQRANLAAVLEEGMKAVTIRVDEVVGVAGFVLPGDHVDVLLTRMVDKGGAYADVIMQDVKVLAIDQTNDDRANKPSVARSVTVEVATNEAQRLIVAQNVGAMTLVLRPVGTTKTENNRRITTADLLVAPKSARDGDIPVASFNPNVTVGVIRGGERKEYAVPPSRQN